MAAHLAAIPRADPLSRPAVPVDGHQRLVGPFPVLRQQRGVLIEPVSVEPFDGAGHRRMDRLAALAELRAVRHLLGQRMLEGVLRLRVKRRLVEELPAHQLRHRRGQLGLGKGCHPVEDQPRDFLADHGGGPEDLLLARRQPVDPRGEDRLHRRREGELGRRPDQPIRPLRAGEVPGLHQRLHDLLDEERVPAGARANALTEPRK